MSELNDTYEQVDRAILFFSKDKWLDKWQVQKGVFYFMWLLSINRKKNFIELANMLGIEPYKQGPFSEAIEGEVEGLVKDKLLEVRNADEKNMEVHSSPKGVSEYLRKIPADEGLLLSQVKAIVDKLTPHELVFFIYFNPYIPDEVKQYFISKSEMKSSFESNHDYYLNKLVLKGLIDEFQANRIRSKVTDKHG
jgi:hypothetical protein